MILLKIILLHHLQNLISILQHIFWLYLIVERIDFVFDVVNKDNKSKLFSDFKENNFKTSQLIKK